MHGEDSTEINVSGLKTGCYLINVKTDKNKMVILKLVKK